VISRAESPSQLKLWCCASQPLRSQKEKSYSVHTCREDDPDASPKYAMAGCSSIRGQTTLPDCNCPFLPIHLFGIPPYSCISTSNEGKPRQKARIRGRVMFSRGISVFDLQGAEQSLQQSRHATRHRPFSRRSAQIKADVGTQRPQFAKGPRRGLRRSWPRHREAFFRLARS
jgi:hypothetical protein